MRLILRILACVVACGLSAMAQTPEPVPLQQGLTVVTSLSDRTGDYESIKTVTALTPDGVTLAYSADIPTSGGPSRKVNVRRTVRREDLKSAHEYMQTFGTATPEVVAGTTAIGASAAVLNELKTKGQTAFTFQTPGRQPPMDKVLSMLTGRGASGGSLDSMAKALDASKASGTLTRVEASDVPFPVLVNGVRTTLPALHARGTFDDLHVEFYFLDDPDNPLALKWSTGSPTGALQVVQISYAVGQQAAQIEQSLKQSGRAEVHGIFFDFGSATLRSESEPVLKDIAETLTKNPSWKLSVEGHTDNIGSDMSNLDLSKRRAEAVKAALVSTYHVDGSRLTTTGYGATQPRESNDTPEGRARNRRVELVKQ